MKYIREIVPFCSKMCFASEYTAMIWMSCQIALMDPCWTLNCLNLIFYTTITVNTAKPT